MSIPKSVVDSIQREWLAVCTTADGWRTELHKRNLAVAEAERKIFELEEKCSELSQWMSDIGIEIPKVKLDAPTPETEKGGERVREISRIRVQPCTEEEKREMQECTDRCLDKMAETGKTCRRFYEDKGIVPKELPTIHDKFFKAGEKEYGEEQS